MKDARIVYGMCTWWDTIDQCSKLPSGLPCCPHCGSVLFEAANEKEWWQGVDEAEKTNPGHRAKVESWRGRCSRTEGFDPNGQAPPMRGGRDAS